MMTDRSEQVEPRGRPQKRLIDKAIFNILSLSTRYMKSRRHKNRIGDLETSQEEDRGKYELPARPPEPPLLATPATATDPYTDPETLWLIARQEPELRRWLVANPSASASLLEAVSQLGGPGVRRALEILLDISP